MQSVPIPSYSHFNQFIRQQRAIGHLQVAFLTLSLIPIPMGFPLGYSRFHPIPKRAQQNNKV